MRKERPLSCIVTRCAVAKSGMRTFHLALCHAQNGKATDEFGVHYLVLAAILETPGDEDCYGWVDVYRDRLELIGAGEMQSAVLPFPEAAVAANMHELRLDADSQAEQEKDTLDRIEVSAP